MGSGRRSVLVDGDRGAAGHRLAHGPGFADRRREHDDDRVRAEGMRQAQEPADDEGDVTADDAAPMVQFIDDEVLEGGEEAGPALVPREHHVVQVVRVREDDVGVRARPVLRLARGVAVRGRRAHEAQGGSFGAEGEQSRQAGQLIGRQGFRRREVEAGRAPADRGDPARFLRCDQVGQDRGPRGRGFARARARGEDDIVPGADGVEGFGLVAPWGGCALGAPGFDEVRCDPVGPCREAFGAAGDDAHVDEAVIARGHGAQEVDEVLRRGRGGGGAGVRARRLLSVGVPGCHFARGSTQPRVCAAASCM